MADFTRIGFGQVEENQLSYYHTGQMFASLPLDKSVQVLQNGEYMYYDYATNKVTAGNDAEGSVEAYNPVGEPMLVLNEIKLYEDYLSLKDFAMIRVGDNYVTGPAAVGRIATASVNGMSAYQDGSLTAGVDAEPAHSEYGYRMDGIAPRLVKTNIGDVYTTNMVKLGVEYNQGDILVPTRTKTEVVKYEANGSTKKVNQYTLVLSPVEELPAKGMAWVVAKVYTMPDGQPGVKLQRIQ